MSHARFSPSKLEALEQCPCFEYKKFEVKEDEESPADRGTRLHLALATRDLGLCNDEHERLAVYKCLAYIEGLELAHPGCIVLTEQKVTIPELTYGTLDYALLSEDRTEAWVQDFKFIRTSSISDPARNFQVQCYVGGLFYEIPTLERVHAGLLAPHLGYAPDLHTYVRGDLAAIEARIVNTLAVVNDVFKKPAPSEICGNCANAARCPALGATAVAVVRNIGLPVPAAFQPDSMTSPRDRAIGHVIANMLENWAEQVKKGNNAYAKAGGEVDGHRLIRSSNGVRIDDVVAAARALQKSGVISFDHVWGAARLSIPKLVEAVADVRKCKKEAAREALLEIIQPYVKDGGEKVYLQLDRSVSKELLLEGKTDG